MSRKRYRRRIGILAVLPALVFLPVAATSISPTVSDVMDGSQLVVGTPQLMNLRFCLGEQTCEVADVNGDGRDDLVVFTRATLGHSRLGEVWVARSEGNWFRRPERWITGFCQGNEDCQVGDVDNDGNADLIAFVKDTRGEAHLGQVLIARSSGSSFYQPVSAEFEINGVTQSLIFCTGNEVCRVDNVDGQDGVDLVAFTRDTKPDRRGYVWLARTSMHPNDTRAKFLKPQLIKTDFCIAEEECALGNVDGHYGDDLIAFVRETRSGQSANDVWVYLTDNYLTMNAIDTNLWHDTFCLENEQCLVGNIDGQAGDDIIAFGSVVRDGKVVNRMQVALAESDRFNANVLTFEGDFCPGNDVCKLGDVDNNKQVDVIAFDRTVDKSKCISNVTISFINQKSNHNDLTPAMLTVSTHPKDALDSNRSPSTSYVFLPIVMAPPALYCTN